MRVMVLALVLANALFFMWSTWVAEPPVDVSPREAGGGPKLTLLTELDNAPVAEQDAADAMLAAEPGVAANETAADDASIAVDASAQLEPMLETSADAPLADSAEEGGAVAAVAETGVDEAVATAVEDGDAVSASPPPAQADAIEPEVAAPAAEPLPDAVTPAAAEPVQVALADTVEQCASMGPFPDLRQATEAASRLRANGFEPRQRLAEEQVWVGHWVYLPSYPTRNEAIAVVERLRELGVNDLYIEPRGDRENAVSLGLFSDRENAELYAGQVRQHDVRPQITDRYRVGSAYWVDIALTTGQPPDPAAYQLDEARKLRLEPRACDAPRVAERDPGN